MLKKNALSIKKPRFKEVKIKVGYQYAIQKQK